MWLIAIGSLLIGFVGYEVIFHKPQQGKVEHSETRHEQPTAPPQKWFLYAASLGCWGVGAYLFYNVGVNQGWYAFSYLVFAIILFVAGRRLFDAARSADQEHASNLRARVDGAVAKTNFEAEKINFALAKQVTYEKHELERDRRETEREALRTTRNELNLRNQLLDVGLNEGLTPEAIVDINTIAQKERIRLEGRRSETRQDLEAGDYLETKDQQVIKKLTRDLAEEVRARQNVIDGNDHPEVKQILIGRHDKNIAYLEAQIDARQAGHLLPENRQAPKRLTRSSSDSGGDYPAAVDRDDY